MPPVQKGSVVGRIRQYEIYIPKSDDGGTRERAGRLLIGIISGIRQVRSLDQEYLRIETSMILPSADMK